eukprot:m.242619 g.242619  ORF g.242619 m.242619 type:complete len:387 (-) comp19442_c2_seq25:1752-2912(-)
MPTDTMSGFSCSEQSLSSAKDSKTKAMLRWAFNAGKWQPTEKQWRSAAAIIQDEERARIGRFVFVDDTKLAMVGRLLMRQAVRSALGVHNREIRLARTKENKPYLEAPPSAQLPHFNFNVSHSGDYTVLAASPQQLVGVDVMEIRHPNNDVGEFFRLMRPQFTPIEWDDILAPACDMDRLHLFYRYWSLKESYIKAVGVGLGLDLQRLEFTSAPTLTPQTRHNLTTATLKVDGMLDSNWRFSQTYLDNDHCVAVALGPRTDAIPSYLSALQSHSEPVPGNASVGAGTAGHTGTRLLEEKQEPGMFASLTDMLTETITYYTNDTPGDAISAQETTAATELDVTFTHFTFDDLTIHRDVSPSEEEEHTSFWDLFCKKRVKKPRKLSDE